MLRVRMNYHLGFIKTLSPLLLVSPLPIILDIDGIWHVSTQQIIFGRLTCKENNWLLYCFALMCFVCNELYIWYIQGNFANIFQILYICPWTQKMWVLVHQFSVVVMYIHLHRRVIISHHICDNHPPLVQFLFHINAVINSIPLLLP